MSANAQVASVGDMPHKGFELCGTACVNICFQIQWRHLRPGEHPSYASQCQLGEVDVIPNTGVVECGLAPSMTDMSNTYPCQFVVSCIPF